MELVALFRGEPGERFRMDPLQLGGLRCPQQVVVAGHCRTGGRVVLRRGVGPTGREAAAGGAARPPLSGKITDAAQSLYLLCCLCRNADRLEFS